LNSSEETWWWVRLPNTDSILAATTMIVFFLGLFLVLLALKLVLGMLLLKFARNRYKGIKKREHESQTQSQQSQGKEKEKESYNTEGKRLGSWGMTEMEEDKKRWIYEDDKETLRSMKEKEGKWREKSDKMGIQEFGKISRYDMVKRIW
jgi:F0F1-type ATP synthase membrane subunit b/b'